jgi:hypothetical protein
MKLCKDCKHHKDTGFALFTGKRHECHQHKVKTMDLVSGVEKEYVLIFSCYASRDYHGACGEEGKFWEAK